MDLSLVGMADASTATSAPMFDTMALTQVFGSTAIGGGVGAMLGAALLPHHKARKSRRAHA